MQAATADSASSFCIWNLPSHNRPDPLSFRFPGRATFPARNRILHEGFDSRRRISARRSGLLRIIPGSRSATPAAVPTGSGFFGWPATLHRCAGSVSPRQRVWPLSQHSDARPVWCSGPHRPAVKNPGRTAAASTPPASGRLRFPSPGVVAGRHTDPINDCVIRPDERNTDSNPSNMDLTPLFGTRRLTTCVQKTICFC